MLTYFFAAIITMATPNGTEIQHSMGIFETQAECQQNIQRGGVKEWALARGGPAPIILKEEGVTECTKLETPLPDAVVAQDVPFIDKEDQKYRDLIRKRLYERQFYPDPGSYLGGRIMTDLQFWRFQVAEAHGLLNPGTPKMEKDQVIPFK